MKEIAKTDIKRRLLHPMVSDQANPCCNGITLRLLKCRSNRLFLRFNPCFAGINRHGIPGAICMLLSYGRINFIWSD